MLVLLADVLPALAIRGQFGLTDGQAWLASCGFAVAMVATCLIHEIGHAIVGRMIGLEPKVIRIFGLGASTEYSRYAVSPREEALCAISGPLANILAAAIAAGLGFAVHREDFATVVVVFCLINLGLVAVNLLPLYPHDGGQIIHAGYWLLLGSELTALRGTGFTAGILVTVCAGSAIYVASTGLLTLGLLLGFQAGYFAFVSIKAIPHRQSMLATGALVANFRGVFGESQAPAGVQSSAPTI